ncbi:ATP-NAD kinase-like domain-containing protein [Parasitella parasitica]|nr:ATP-NAD kinase-like domain-containing protein [Parasitella parasitica]
MPTSISAKNQEQKPTRLTIGKHKLVIELLNNDNSTQADKTETIDFQYIYGADQHGSSSLEIHTAIMQDLTTEKTSGNETQTLTNIRPKDAKWLVKTLRYQIDTEHAAAATELSSLSEFAKQLKDQVAPHHLSLPDTEVIVILNPTSGARLAEMQWKSIVKPMLITAGFTEPNLTKITTERDGKTRALAEALGQRILATSDGKPAPIILSMGGDGTLHEVVNGLSDAATAKEEARQGQFRLAIVPAGSGNAFALGIGIESVEQATLKIIKGLEEKPFYFMDVKFGHSQYNGDNWQDHIDYDATKKPVRLLVVMSWGFHAQIVSKSRYLRYFMGNKRFSLVAMFLLKFLQQYEGELVLKDAKKYDHAKQEFDQQTSTTTTLKDDKFTYFIVSKQHSLEKGFRIAPFASPLSNDMDVVILRDADADSLTKASIAAFQGGGHVKSENVEYFKASELFLRVRDKAELCLDGEIHDLPSKGIIHLKVETSSTKNSSFTIFI